MIDIAWKNMWTRKTRTILTTLGIAVALELVIATNGRRNNESFSSGE